MDLVHHGLCSHTVDLALNVENGMREAITDNVPREREEGRGVQRKIMEENGVKMYRQIYTTQDNLSSVYSTVYNTVYTTVYSTVYSTVYGTVYSTVYCIYWYCILYEHDVHVNYEL